MLIDYASINRRDIADLALRVVALPEYDHDRERMTDDIRSAARELFPDTEAFGYGHVAYAAASDALNLARCASDYWNEYVLMCERVAQLKRAYRDNAHNPMARYEAWCQLGWAREYRDQVKARALECARDLMAVDSEAFLKRV